MKRVLAGLVALVILIFAYRQCRPPAASRNEVENDAENSPAVSPSVTSPSLATGTGENPPAAATGTQNVPPSGAARGAVGTAGAAAFARPEIPRLTAQDYSVIAPYLLNAASAEVEAAAPYRRDFPATGIGHLNEASFGVVTEDVRDPVAFLKTRITLTAADAALTSERRTGNEFFKRTSGKSFQGFLLDPNNLSFGRLEAAIGIDGIDGIRSYQGENVYEQRQIPLAETALWRFDLDQQGIFLVQNRCPWNLDLSLERKQFFFLEKSGQLVANIYCGRKTGGGETLAYQWKFVGFYVSDPQ